MASTTTTATTEKTETTPATTVSNEKKAKKKEPIVDRMVQGVVAPPTLRLEKDEVFDSNNKLQLGVLRDHLLKEGRLSDGLITEILNQGSAILKKEPNVLSIPYPVTVVGDIHGQFFDLIRLFEVGGDPKDTKYLFLGDYVDRGCFGTEVVFYLLSLKICYPTTIFFLRGNHESRQLTAFFNFKNECIYKYDEEVYEQIMNTFENLPFSGVVNESFYCVHGGLSPDMIMVDEMQELDRFKEVPREGPICDFLWSDPFEEEEGGDSDGDENEATSWFGYNETRQCSYIYGLDAVKHFLEENNLTSVIRAHEAQVDGYKMHMINESTGIPRVITIFSAPNYCDVYNNKAACLKFDNAVLNIKQFIASPHPYYLPNFMDVFQWSLPFVAEKVTDMLITILETEESDDEEEPVKIKEKDGTIDDAKVGVLKQKVLAVTKVMKMYRVLRENHERIVKLKQLLPDNQLPVGLLEGGDASIKEALSSFANARKVDMTSGGEAMPGGTPGEGKRRSSIKGKASIRPKKIGTKSSSSSSTTTATTTIVTPKITTTLVD